jgi:hypothetical protein
LRIALADADVQNSSTVFALITALVFAYVKEVVSTETFVPAEFATIPGDVG